MVLLFVWVIIFPGWVHMHLQAWATPLCKAYDSIYCKKRRVIYCFIWRLSWFEQEHGCRVYRQNEGGFGSEAVWSRLRHSELPRSSSTDGRDNRLVYKQHEIMNFRLSLIKSWLSNGRRKWWRSSGSSLALAVSSCCAVQCSAVHVLSK